MNGPDLAMYVAAAVWFWLTVRANGYAPEDAISSAGLERRTLGRGLWALISDLFRTGLPDAVGAVGRDDSSARAPLGCPFATVTACSFKLSLPLVRAM